MNYLITTCLVRHHKEFSKLVSGQNHAAASFRRLGSVQGMKNYVLHPFKASQNLSRKAEKSVTNAFAESPSESDFHSDKEEPSSPSNSSKRNRTAKRPQRGKGKATMSRQRMTICPPDDEDTSSHYEEIIKSCNNKRTPIHQLVDELENEVQNPRKKNKK